MSNKEDKDNKYEQERLMELQYLDSQIKQSEEQMTQIETQIAELNDVIMNLSEIKDMKPGSEILLPIANGIFAEAEIKNVKKLRVNVGAGVVTEKTPEQTTEMLKEHLNKIESYKEEMFMQLQAMVNQASLIQKELIKKKD